jgi:hypothetical protein
MSASDSIYYVEGFPLYIEYPGYSTTNILIFKYEAIASLNKHG